MRRAAVVIAALALPAAANAGFAVPPLDRPFTCETGPLYVSEPDDLSVHTHRLTMRGGRLTVTDMDDPSHVLAMAADGPTVPVPELGQPGFRLSGKDGAKGLLRFDEHGVAIATLFMPQPDAGLLLYGPCTAAPDAAPTDRLKVN